MFAIFFVVVSREEVMDPAARRASAVVGATTLGESHSVREFDSSWVKSFLKCLGYWYTQCMFIPMLFSRYNGNQDNLPRL